MKRLAIALAALMIITCSKQDSTTDYLIGTWQLTKTIDERYDSNGYITNRSDTAVAWDERMSFSTNGSAIHSHNNGESYEYAYTYDEKNKLLTINKKSYSIEELTNTSLIICSQTIYSDSFGKGYVYNRKCWKKVK